MSHDNSTLILSVSYFNFSQFSLKMIALNFSNTVFVIHKHMQSYTFLYVILK